MIARLHLEIASRQSGITLNEIFVTSRFLNIQRFAGEIDLFCRADALKTAETHREHVHLHEKFINGINNIK